MPDEAFREFERLFEESDIMSFRMKVLDLAEVTYKAVMENGTRVCKVHYREVTSENPPRSTPKCVPSGHSDETRKAYCRRSQTARCLVTSCHRSSPENPLSAKRWKQVTDNKEKFVGMRATHRNSGGTSCHTRNRRRIARPRPPDLLTWLR
mmetsp:Transcript_24759/g.62144  ORF Transcript_24759/g.62144 Transcript_24759/m.62144 type:complete len:151 (+) Transcript_24759:183-635(+)